MIRIIADERIPFIKGILEPFAQMVYMPGEAIRREHLVNADGLIIRTRTHCDRELLHGTKIRFIATATIGFDHIDTGYCESFGISWHNAAGCNASGVYQYIAAALLQISVTHPFCFSGKTIGVVGVGNVGSRVVKLAEILGMNILQNDPPRERAEGTGQFVPLEQILAESDIITLHVPLTSEGADRTFHLADENFFARLEKKPYLINTSRGGVVDEKILKQHILKNSVSGAILDVWEHEPSLDKELLGLANIATPHIAGYSTEGKANGTAFCVQQASKFFGFGIDEWYPENLPQPKNRHITIDPTGKSLESILHESVRESYDIMADDGNLRQHPDHFERHRNEYPARREFTAFVISLQGKHPEAESKLRKLGFII